MNCFAERRRGKGTRWRGSSTAAGRVFDGWSRSAWTRALASRVDPSDVVQETLVEAIRKLPDYITQRRLPFYSWLRELASERLAGLCRRISGPNCGA